MHIVSSYNTKKNIKFGVNYSNELLQGMSEITERFQHAKKYLNKKFVKNTDRKSLLHMAQNQELIDEFVQNNAKNKMIFSILSNCFPYRTLFISKNKKDNKFYFTMRTFLGKKFLAPIRTKNNLNPIEHPEAIHIRFKDLKEVAKKLYLMKTEQKISNFLHRLF